MIRFPFPHGDRLRAFFDRIIRSLWLWLVNNAVQENASQISMFWVRFILNLKPELVNEGLTIDGENVALLDIILTKSPTRYDLVKYLIEKGARFEECLCPRYMERNCDFLGEEVMDWRTISDEKRAYYGNAIFYLSYSLANLYFDINLQNEYEFDSEQFQELIDYICTLKGPNCMLAHGFPLLAYMPTPEMIEFLLSKGVDPDLEYPQFENKNVVEILFSLSQYERLDIFLSVGLTNIRNVKTEVIKKNRLPDSTYVLTNPILSQNLSDLDKAHLITIPCYTYIQDDYNLFEIYAVTIRKRGKETIHHRTCGHELKDLIVELATNSEKIYRIFDRLWIFVELTLFFEGEDKVQFKAFLQEKEREFGSEHLFDLKVYKCLPDGYIPKFQLKWLNEDEYSEEELEENAREILGVTATASSRDITVAYYKLIRKHHPDRNLGRSVAKEETQCLTKAKDLLLKGQ